MGANAARDGTSRDAARYGTSTSRHDGRTSRYGGTSRDATSNGNARNASGNVQTSNVIYLFFNLFYTCVINKSTTTDYIEYKFLCFINLYVSLLFCVCRPKLFPK